MSSKAEKILFDPDWGLNKKMVNGVIDLARAAADKEGRPIRVMEVCGTHTAAIARIGIAQLVSDCLDIRSGPGCPVCVTHQDDLDYMIALALQKNTAIVTFGDLIRVPGSSTTLEEQKAKGAHIQICYSPMEALDICLKYPKKEVVFLGIGFETTIPSLAITVRHAYQSDVKNFSMVTSLKTILPALNALLCDREHNIDGLILPGHVAAVLGRKSFEYLAGDYQMPSVITGFEPFDILTGLYKLLELIMNDRPEVLNLYNHVVKETGNEKARKVMFSVFDKEGITKWRGLGEIPFSGLILERSFGRFDAKRRFDLDISFTGQNSQCECGEIITGKKTPFECPLFNKSCTPASPVGPCMVSAEGACSSYYKYLL